MRLSLFCCLVLLSMFGMSSCTEKTANETDWSSLRYNRGKSTSEPCEARGDCPTSSRGGFIGHGVGPFNR